MLNNRFVFNFQRYKFKHISKRDVLAIAKIVYEVFNGHNVIAKTKGNECSMSSLCSHGKYDVLCVAKLADFKVPVSFKVVFSLFSYKMTSFKLLVRVDNKISQKFEVPYDVEQKIKAFMIDYGYKAIADKIKSEIAHHRSLVVEDLNAKQ